MVDELNEEELENVTGGYQDKVTQLLAEIHQLEKEHDKHPKDREQIIARLKELREELKNYGLDGNQEKGYN